jgi:molybdenum cofactor cytidylyltransferase
MAGLHGIVLAGGISSRMGFPKALMPCGSSFFLLEVYRRLAGADIKPVYMVINTGLKSSLEAQLHNFPEGQFVLNSDPSRGQLHSLCLGLEAAANGGATGAVVALVDQPAILPTTFTAVAAAAAANPQRIILPAFNGKNGHPFVIPRDAFTAFLSAADGDTAREVIRRLSSITMTVEVPDENILRDIDSPEDMARASRPTAADENDLD